MIVNLASSGDGHYYGKQISFISLQTKKEVDSSPLLKKIMPQVYLQITFPVEALFSISCNMHAKNSAVKSINNLYSQIEKAGRDVIQTFYFGFGLLFSSSDFIDPIDPVQSIFLFW